MTKYHINFDELLDCKYSLIGIHSNVEDYKIAFLINKILSFNLKKINDLEFKNKNSKSFYSIYENNEDNENYKIYLISNKYKTKVKSLGFFSEIDSYNFLISDKKEIDFFLKIEGNTDSNYNLTIINKLNTISQIISSYQININTLKTKENLIF